MVQQIRPPQRPVANSKHHGNSTAGAKPKPKQEIVKTWLFDSVGNRKYALQIKKAGNGNPCLKIVEGVPAANGTYHRFDITVWSEDFERLFSTLDEVRAYMLQHNIRTPPGHKYDPNGKGKGAPRRKPAAGRPPR